jgi:preprotein translocase subunit SecA
MAGRDTDIRLGGADESQRETVAERGGLLVIGTSRHESRRVDRQLRGRAARQGDPGETRFFVSLEDDLLVRHGGLARLLPAALVPAPQEDASESVVVRREIARAQRVIEGQHWDVRRTLARYAAVVEDQFAAVVAERRVLLDGRGDLGDRVRVAAIDQEWRRHLAHCAELREGAHLARLGGREPLQVFTAGVLASFDGFGEAVDARVDALDAAGAFPPAPATTWTYLVNDDPFRHTMGTLLTGAGGPTIAIYAAVFMAPLLVAWGVADRWLRRKGGTKEEAGQ